VLGDQPRLEGAKQEARGDAAQQAAQHEHPQVGKVLGGARERIGDNVEQGGVAAAEAVGERADDGAKHERRAKAGDEELADGGGAVAVRLVQGVDVGALEPVADCFCLFFTLVRKRRGGGGRRRGEKGERESANGRRGALWLSGLVPHSAKRGVGVGASSRAPAPLLESTAVVRRRARGTRSDYSRIARE